MQLKGMVGTDVLPRANPTFPSASRLNNQRNLPEIRPFSLSRSIHNINFHPTIPPALALIFKGTSQHNCGLVVREWKPRR
jgi:hypothetical protein